MRATMTHLALHVRDVDACIAFYARHCNMRVVQQRPKDSADGPSRIVWMAEPGREREFIFVLLPGGFGRNQAESDFSHFGFALESRAAVDAAAARARADGCLVWEPREEPYPVGYYCGLRDPDGNYVEFSFGQPLGPGAEGQDNTLLGSDDDRSA